MAKRRHEEEQATSSKTTMAVMAIGGLAVVALVVWALTRTVQTAPAATPVASTGTSFPVTTESNAPSTTGVPPGTTASPQTPPPSHEDTAAVTRIAATDLRAKYDAKQVTVIDVRDATSYMGNHIAGALNVPLTQMESQVTFLPKTKPIVTYCT